MSFDLVTEPWIPTLGEHGSLTEHSLTAALLDAHLIPGLAPPTRTMTPALLRHVLLSVVLHALGPPRSRNEWQRRFSQGRFSVKERDVLARYLGEHRDRFDLLSPDWPFAQVGGLTATSGEPKSAALLVPSTASGNNVPLFSATTEADTVEFSPAQAALWLLHTHCWDTAAIKSGAVGDPKVKAGKTTGNPTGPLGQLGVIVPVGRTLYETLLLNTPVLPDGLGPEDRPQWAAATDRYPVRPNEADPATPRWSSRPVRGLLDLMTWQSRRIRLVPTDTPRGTMITQVIVAAGDRLEAIPEEEPHTAWTRTAKPKAGRPGQRPRRHQSGRSAWRGLGTALALSLPSDGEGPLTSLLLRQVGQLDAEGYLDPRYPLRLETYGLEYGNQSAVVENAIIDDLPVPVAAFAAENTDLRNTLLEAVEQAERLARSLDRLLMDLRRAVGGEPLPRDKGDRPSQRLLHVLDLPVCRLLASARSASSDLDALEQLMTAWENTAWHAAEAVGEQLLADAPPAAFGGRVTKEGTYRSALAESGFRNTLSMTLPRAAETRATPTEVTV